MTPRRLTWREGETEKEPILTEKCLTLVSVDLLAKKN